MLSVKSFKEIPIQRNTLVLCDIDDTVIVFEKLGKKWWRERFDDYYERTRNYDISDQEVLKEWVHQIQKGEPVHVDEAGFTDFMERINATGSILVFVTARSSDLADLTISHLKQVGITPKTAIHYTNNESKGDYIANVLDFDDFEHVVFIDDMEHNVNSVERVFGDKVTTYLFSM
uniref:FCP1 homology domain-containing protein n=1 Tax=viral metagenome TaxID=1070528 RepID=A0A6C0BTM0_9ZZZZ